MSETKRLKELVFPGLSDVYTIPQDYEDLENKPDITTDETEDSLSIADPDGNVVFKADADGVRTTQVTADRIILAENKQFGPTLPSNPVIGQLFFLEVDP